MLTCAPGKNGKQVQKNTRGVISESKAILHTAWYPKSKQRRKCENSKRHDIEPASR